MSDYLWLPQSTSYDYNAIKSVGLYLWNRYGSQPLYYASDRTPLIKVARFNYNSVSAPDGLLIFATNQSGRYQWHTLDTYTGRSSLDNTYGAIYYGGRTGPDTSVSNSFFTDLALSLTLFPNLDSALSAMDDGKWEGPVTSYPIEYVTTHCTASGPVEAATGADVVVAFTPNDGYKLTSVTVEDEAGPVPFIRNGDSIAFVMPGPIDA